MFFQTVVSDCNTLVCRLCPPCLYVTTLECVNVLTLIIASVSVRYFIASLSPHTLHHVISDPVCAVCNLYVVYWYVGQFVTLDLV